MIVSDNSIKLSSDDREQRVRTGNDELTKLQIKLSETLADLRTAQEKLAAADEMWSEDIMTSKARETGLRERISDLENRLKLSETASEKWGEWDKFSSKNFREGMGWPQAEDEVLIAEFINTPRNIKRLSELHARSELSIVMRLIWLRLIQMTPSSREGSMPSYTYTDTMLQKVIEHSKNNTGVTDNG